MDDLYINRDDNNKERILCPQTVHEWKHIYNSLNDMITIHDNDFNIIYANSAALKKLNIPDKLSNSIKCYKYYHGSTHPPHNCASCQLLKTGKSSVIEIYEPYLKKTVEISVFPRTNGTEKIIGSVHIVRDITDRKQREKDLSDSAEKLKKLTAHLQQVREAERKRIAREIHDELGQELAVINLELLGLFNKIPQSQKVVRSKIQSLSKRISNSINTVQKIVSELRPALLDKLDLQAAIEWQIEEFQRLTGIECQALFDAELDRIDKEYDIYIYRVFQEILTNIMRHSEASGVTVNFQENNNQLVVTVKDNGKGISKTHLSSHKSFGIIGMNERVFFMGGTLVISGSPGKGTSICLRIPLKQKN